MLQTTGLNRSELDKYYTSDDVVKICIEKIKENLNIDNNDLCIEPSAGNGSFIQSMKLLCNNNLFYDLEPENDEIVKQNYLDINYKLINEKYNKIHIIGNPPFGRQSSQAIKFIKKSCEYCDSISFILPKSFKKDSMKKHFPLSFHLKDEFDLPNNSFIVDNKKYDVPCVFQIWIKYNIDREIPKKLIPIGYEFVKINENPDISFRRVGVYAGKIDNEIETKSQQSHYFIKFNKKLTNEKYTELSNIIYKSKDNTVGPKSISKPELMKEFNKILN